MPYDFRDPLATPPEATPTTGRDTDRARPAACHSLTIRAHCSPIELNRALDAPPKEASPEIDQRFVPKFAECIPDNLLAHFASQRLYDWSAATEVCRMPLVHTSE